jgi:hypothetical protein
MAACVHGIETNIGVSRATRGEPTLICALAQCDTIWKSAIALNDCLTYGHILEADARGCYEELGSVDVQASLIRGLEGERAMGLTLIGQLERGIRPGDTTTTAQEESRRELGHSKGPLRFLMRADRRLFLKEMDRQIRCSSLPYREIRRRGLDKDISEDLPKYALMTVILAPVAGSANRSRDKALASIAQARIALALEAYWDRFGSYPKTLGELRSKVGWKIETDPFSGRDMIYKQLPRGYLLYSISENLKDDGGNTRDYFFEKELAARKKAHPNDWRDHEPDKSMEDFGDIVWRVER